MQKMYLFITITQRDDSDEFTNFFNSKDVSVIYSTPCEGTVRQKTLSLFGLDATLKTVHYCVVTSNKKNELIKTLTREMAIDLPNRGIAVAIPLTSMGGKRALEMYANGHENDTEEEQIMQEKQMELIVAICEKGHTETVMDAARSAGARYVSLIEEPMAAAIGAGLPVREAKGSLVVDIGGGTAEVAVISLGDIVTSRSARCAGDKLDEAIIAHIRKKYNVLIGERTAEEIKVTIGSAYPYENEGTMMVKGRSQIDGLPKLIEISADEIREALADSVSLIVEAIRSTLEKTPPELASDIIDNGIMLTGGGALLRGLDKLIAIETKMPVHIAENPLDCVVNGTGISLESNAL